MNTLPTIEGLEYTSSEIQNLYGKVVSDTQTFLTAYENYIKCSNSNQNCSSEDLKSKLDTVNASVSEFNEAVEKNGANENTFKLEEKLVKLRNEVEQKSKMLTDIKHSVAEDYVIKQESHYYYKMITSVVIACGLYFVFNQIDSKMK